MIVLTFSPLYSVSALLPSPWIFTVEPSLLVFTPPVLASNFKPFSINASAVFLRSVTFTAPFLVLLSPAAASILSKNVLPALSAMEEPTLFNLVGAVVESPALFMEAITSLGATTVPEPSLAVLKVPSGCL